MILRMVVAAAIVVYLGAMGYVYLKQDAWIFPHNDVKPYTTISATQTTFTTKDGIEVEGAYWYSDKPKATLLYFGGNRENAKRFVDTVAPKLKDYDVIAFNYPGYGRSQGVPTQQSLVATARDLIAYYKPDILVGRSLGSAVALLSAGETKLKGVVLITPFDNLTSIAKTLYPIFPVSWLLKYPFAADEAASRINIKSAIIAVSQEDVVPHESLQRLLSKLPRNVYYGKMQDTSHQTVYDNYMVIHYLHKALDALQKEEQE